MISNIEQLVHGQRLEDGRPAARPAQLMDALHSITTVHYYQPAHAVSTGRTGRFEGAWRRSGTGWDSLVWQPTGARAREIDRYHMRLLILAYAEHPDADARLILRTPEFPQSVLLRVEFTTDAPGTYPTVASIRQTKAA